MPDFLKSMSPEKQEILAQELRKSLSGEYGYVADNGQRIQKDATNQVGVATPLGTLPVPLEAPAKLLYPVPTPLRNMIPRDVVGGNSITFRQITGINTQKRWSSVAEATSSTTGRNSFIAFNEKDVTYTWKTLEQESLLTPEAQFGGNGNGQNFNNEEFATLSLLQATMLGEELVILGGNVSALGKVAGVTKTGVAQAATTVGGLTAGTNYYIYVTPLTLQGYYAGVTGQATGVDQQGEGTGDEFTIATAAGGNAGDESITITWTAKAGAVAYNVYIGASTGIANANYYGTYTTCYAQILSVPTSTRPNGADKTANALDYDGLYALCETGTNVYRTDLANATLTGDNKLGVAELDTMFKSFWDNYKVSPDLLIVNSTQRKKIDEIVMGSAAPIVRVEGQFGDQQITAGMAVKSVLNRYMGKDVPILTHPNAVPGTILAVCNSLGEYYPNARIANNLVMKLCWDYRKIDFAMAKRAKEFGIDVRGALVNYAPFAMGAITGIA